MRVTIIPIVIGAFGTVTKGPGGLEYWRTSGDETCCRSNSREKPPVLADVKNSKGSYQRIGARTGDLGNKGMNEDHPDYSFITIGHNNNNNKRTLVKELSQTITDP